MSLKGSISFKRNAFISFTKKGHIEVLVEDGDDVQKILSTSIINLIRQEVMYNSIKPMVTCMEDVDDAGLNHRGIERLRVIQKALHDADIEITNIIKKQGHSDEN